MEKQRILLVEDDVNFGNMLKDTLDFIVYEVTLERDGVQGLSA
jgi:DNA-binding response OmpR family regulator